MLLYKHHCSIATITVALLHCRWPLLPSSSAYHPRKGTADTGSLQCMQIFSRHNCSPAPQIHWKHDLGRESGGGDMGGAMMQTRLEHGIQPGASFTAL
eukprot:4219675-Ditylum_brightwellii.AAC.1